MTASQVTFSIWNILAEYLGYKSEILAMILLYRCPPASTECFTGSSLQSPATFVLSFLLLFFLMLGQMVASHLKVSFRHLWSKSCLSDEIPPWPTPRLQMWATNMGCVETFSLLSLGARVGIILLWVSLWCRNAGRWKWQPLCRDLCICQGAMECWNGRDTRLGWSHLLEIRALSQCAAPALQPVLGGICARGMQGAIIPVLNRQLKNISAKISVGTSWLFLFYFLHFWAQ